MSKLQFLKVAILALVGSSLSSYLIIARPSTSLSEKQLLSQTTSIEETETIKGEITEIENSLVRVQTAAGTIKEITISETEQQKLGLKPGNIVSVTISKTASGEEIPEKVMLEEESALTTETTNTDDADPTSTQLTTELSTEPVSALW